LNPLRLLAVHVIRQDPSVAPGDVDVVAALAEIIHGEMSVDSPSIDLAIALACQHLADIRSELIEAGRRAVDGAVPG
jgi:hypothetical protein